MEKPQTLADGIKKVVDAEKQEKENAVGRNGGRLCDTRRGPCSCGAWH